MKVEFVTQDTEKCPLYELSDPVILSGLILEKIWVFLGTIESNCPLNMGVPSLEFNCISFVWNKWKAKLLQWLNEQNATFWHSSASSSNKNLFKQTALHYLKELHKWLTSKKIWYISSKVQKLQCSFSSLFNNSLFKTTWK